MSAAAVDTAAVPAAEPAAAAAGEVTPAPTSALEENIVSKGKNSYYYAHAGNLGRGADKKNYGTPPRLLSKQASDAGARKERPLKLITDYAWCDSGKKVKVYVTKAGVCAVPDENVTITSTKTSFELKIVDLEGIDYLLSIPVLNDEIQKATCKRKKSSSGEDKVIVFLTKENDFTWYDLKKDK